jgi:tetratricopeptide (TPR) repeat protein
VAAEFFEKAVAEDPEFASAHVWLGYAYIHLKREEEILQHFQRAFELADTTTDAERYFILGSYYWQHSTDLPKAAQAFEALWQIHPDHLWATAKLAMIYGEMGDKEKEMVFRLRHADLRPNDFLSNALAAQRLVDYKQDSPRAKPYAERARALLTPEMAKQFSYVASLVEVLPVREHLSKGEVAQAIAVLTRVETRLQEGASEDSYIWRIGGAYMDTGKLKKAEEVYAHFKDDKTRYYFISWADYSRGDWNALREHLKMATGRNNYGPRDVHWFASVGLLAEARAALAVIEGRKRPEAYLALARGYLAQAQGKTDKAVQLFERARQEWKPPDFWQHIEASAALARIREQQGDLKRAIELLEPIRAQRARLYQRGSGSYWLETQFHLAKLYRKAGRQREAEAIEDELRKLLVYADADHVLARELRQRQQAALTPPSK